MLEDVKEFADKFNQPKLDAPGFLPEEVMKNRLDFQFEELLETAHAAGFYFNSEEMEFKKFLPELAKIKMNLAEVLDGLVDQVYVALGTAYAMGFLEEGYYKAGAPFMELAEPFKIAWDRVHAANMKKVSVPGMWKIQKPKGWVRPDLEDLVK